MAPHARVAELVDAHELKIVFRKEWGFDSLHGHHKAFADVRGCPKVTKKQRLDW